eukprot:scpid83020/ scgid28188/ MOSC domain-containing protein 2, mitochondrial; Mitochondrial amidoxime reducing component 2; Moco sulfurase C-terminal domain-containing protein 2; Molybdenum cofactor sulfurase C-terminal domain-containing protein 2
MADKTSSGDGGAPVSSSSLSPIVTEINIYPIKSCKAVCVESITVDKLGLTDDRRLMLIDSNNRFLHQRKFPKLATVIAVIKQNNTLHLSAPNKEPAVIEICRVSRADRPVRNVGVWQATLPAIDQGDEAAAWFQSIFDSSQSFARLVAMPELDSEECVPRPIPFPASFPKIPDRQVGFSDSGPILVLSEESLADLNARYEAGWQQSVPMTRFRPNIVVKGGGVEAFDEDRWLVVQIGSVPFMAYQKATRCKMTGVDQATGEVDKVGPLEALRTYRATRGPAHAEFGQFLVPLKVGGAINVGDAVKVLEYKKA